MPDILFITAFKDIGRSTWNHWQRSNDEYLGYFHHLATNIDYTLVVFVDNAIETELKRRYTFRSNIVFVDINRVKTFYDDYLPTQQSIVNSETYRAKIPDERRNNPEHVFAEYNLINHSKFNFVSYAKKQNPEYDFYSWIDFGFTRSKDENVPVNIDTSLLPTDRITYQLDEQPTTRIDPNDMLKSNTIYFMGSSNIIPNSLVEQFEDIYRTKIEELQQMWVVDDDQNVLLQIYYDYNRLFNTFVNRKWFSFYTRFRMTNRYRFDEKRPTELCEIMGRNKSDKGSLDITRCHHNYTTFYDSIFQTIKNRSLRVFELGLGTNNPNIPSSMGINGRPGASLYGWNEYFTNAKIFGADIDTDILFNTDAIKTFYCDQTSPDVIRNMWNSPELAENFDIIVEDGLHAFSANVCFFENSIHKLNVGGYYIIEDILNYEFHLFNAKIKEWEDKYSRFEFCLLQIPSTVNNGDNNLLVIQRLR